MRKKLKALWLLLTSDQYFLTVLNSGHEVTCSSKTTGKLERFTQEQVTLIINKRKGIKLPNLVGSLWNPESSFFWRRF